ITIIPAINLNIRMILQDVTTLPSQLLALLMMHPIMLRYRSNLQYMIILLYVAGASPMHFIEDKSWDLNWYCQVAETQCEEMTGICEHLRTLVTQSNAMDIEIPDQFMDPITCTL